MVAISDLTYKVVAYSETHMFDVDECVDWALEMLELGHCTENLLIMAGIMKPTNYNEVREYLKLALEELGLKSQYGEAAVISYSAYFIMKLAKGADVKKNLHSIFKYYQDSTDNFAIQTFYLLWLAWEDLDYHNNGQHYWVDANKQNIESMVIEEAKKWLEKNKPALDF